MSIHDSDEFPLAANIVIGIGVALAIVMSTWTTIIAFIGGTMPVIGWETDGGIGVGVAWMIFADPIVVTVCYWLTMLVALPIVAVSRPRD